MPTRCAAAHLCKSVGCGRRVPHRQLPGLVHGFAAQAGAEVDLDAGHLQRTGAGQEGASQSSQRGSRQPAFYVIKREAFCQTRPQARTSMLCVHTPLRRYIAHSTCRLLPPAFTAVSTTLPRVSEVRLLILTSMFWVKM